MTRVRSWWFGVQDTLWPIPAGLTLAAVLLALGTIAVDRAVIDRYELQAWWLFSGGAEGARGVLSTIAGTVMTIATTAFSITLVALQLGSSQFSPRILRGFTGDRGNQIVLGVFVATFAYTLVVMRAVRSESADGDAFVPSIATTIAIAMAFGSIAALIYFFHHATRTIQAPVILDRAYRDTTRLIAQERTVREGLALVPVATMGGGDVEPDSLTVRSSSHGYVQQLDLDRLRTVAERHRLTIRVLVQLGDPVFSHMPIATVAPHGDASRELDHGVPQACESAVVLGIERTLEGDIGFGVQQIADICLRALSPSVNDPTTAMTCIDVLGQTLIECADLTSGDFALMDDAGHPLAIGFRPGFRSFLTMGFEQVMQDAVADGAVTIHLVRTLAQVARCADQGDEIGAIDALASRVDRLARQQEWFDEDGDRFEEALASLRGAVQSRLLPTPAESGG